MNKQTWYGLSAVMAMVILFGGVSAFAYSSVGVTPSSPLFGLKAGVESVEVAIASQGLATVKAYAKIADRRMAEAAYISARDAFKVADADKGLIAAAYAQETDASTVDYAIVDAIALSLDSVDAAIAEAETITDPQDAGEALAVIADTQTTQVTTLEDIATDVGVVVPEVVDAVAEAITETEDELAEVQTEIADVETETTSGAETVTVNVETDEEKEAKALTQVEVESLLTDAQSATDAWKAGLSAAVDSDDAEKLFNRVDKKLEKVQESIDSGNFNQARGLLKASSALQNNGKHFLKDKDDEDEDEDEDADEQEDDADTNSNVNASAANTNVNAITNANTNASEVEEGDDEDEEDNVEDEEDSTNDDEDASDDDNDDEEGDDR